MSVIKNEQFQKKFKDEELDDDQCQTEEELAKTLNVTQQCVSNSTS